MKRLVLIALLLGGMIGSALAESAIVTTSWLRLRNAPSAEAKAVDVVYGNDAYLILKKEEQWVQVRTKKGVVGWLPTAKLTLDGMQKPSDEDGKEELAAALSLQRRGYRQKAQEALVDILKAYPYTFEHYQALRHLLYYFPVSMLPSPEGEMITPAGILAAERLAKKIIPCSQADLPLPKRFWQVEYVKEGYRPILGPLPQGLASFPCR